MSASKQQQCEPPNVLHQYCLERFIDGANRMGNIEATCGRIEDTLNRYVPYLDEATRKAAESARFWSELNARLALAGIIGAMGLAITAVGYLITQWLKSKGIDL